MLPCQCARGMDLFQPPSLHVPVWLPLRMGGWTLQAAITWFCLWILRLVRGPGSCGSFSFNLYVLKFPYPEKWKRSGGSQCLQGHSALYLHKSILYKQLITVLKHSANFQTQLFHIHTFLNVQNAFLVLYLSHIPQSPEEEGCIPSQHSY